MLERQNCPQCSSVGIKSQLETYQINLEEAIVLCENKQCTYPIEKPHESVTSTFQRSFSKIAQTTTLPDVAHKALHDRVASHMRKNGHSLQKDDIGIQTDTSKTRRKQKSSVLWRKHRSLTSSVDVSQCFQKFQLLSNGHENSETKARRGCYGSDGASDRDSSNSSQDGVESTNQSSYGFPSENCISRLNGCSLYQGFQFSNEGSNVFTSSDANSNTLNVTDMEQVVGNLEQDSDLKHQNNIIPGLPSNNVLHGRDASVQSKHVSIQGSGASTQTSQHLKSMSCVQHCNSLSEVQMSDNFKSLTNGQIYCDNKNKTSIQTVVTASASMTKEQNESLTFPLKFPQWRNRDALCWLDVILCLAVHNEKLKSLVFGETFDRGNIIYKLVKAHQQATQLINGNNSRNLNGKRRLNGVVLSDLDNSIKQQDVITAQCDSVFKLNYTSQSDHAPYTDQAQQTDHASPPSKASYIDCITKAENILNDVREEIWSILNKKLKCAKGKPESPVFALPLLLHQSSMVEELFKMKYRFVYQCSQCKRDETSQHSNCLPTFPTVPEDFNPSFPQHLKTCSHCRNNKDQRDMMYEKLPETLLMHFTDGIPHTDFTRLQFSHHGNVYTVTGVVQYKKNPNHFVAWLRNPYGKNWMRCDDLKSMVCDYQTSTPSFPSEQVHIVMWETLEIERESSKIVVKEPATPKMSINSTKLTSENGLGCSSKIQDIRDSLKTSVKLSPLDGVMSGPFKGVMSEPLKGVMSGPLKGVNVTKVTLGEKNKKLELLNLCSNVNRSSTLSTDSSDSILLPHFVTSTPVTGTLLKPEPMLVNTLHTMSKETSNRLARNEDTSNELEANVSSVLTGCEISGERRSLQPSSVFVVPVKSVQSLERSDKNIVTKSVPSLEHSDNLYAKQLCPTSECSLSDKQEIHGNQKSNLNKLDQNTILKEAETHVRKTSELLIGKKSVEKIVKCVIEANPITDLDSDSGVALIKNKEDSKNGNNNKTCLREIHKSNSNKTPVTTFREKSSSACFVDSQPGSVKHEMTKVTAMIDSSAKNNKFGSMFPKKSRFKVPIPAVKKASISKDAFFTLDVKSKTLQTNSALNSAAVATGLNGDVSVLNSVKQYLLSRTTDKLVPKLKFKGMDLKSSSRASSCTELELPKSEPSRSMHTLCYEDSLSLNGNSHQKRQKVCDLKRKSDVLTPQKTKRKCGETSVSALNDASPEDLGDRGIGGIVMNQTDSSSVEIEVNNESGNSNNDNVDKYEGTLQLKNLYKALNIPYNSVSDLVCATTDVNDIFDCFKIT